MQNNKNKAKGCQRTLRNTKELKGALRTLLLETGKQQKSTNNRVSTVVRDLQKQLTGCRYMPMDEL